MPPKLASSIAWGLALTLSMWSVPLHGQAVAGAQIAGNVTDPSGAAVANAKVTATHTDTNTVFTAFTGANGAYAMPNLRVGPYTMDVAAEGFTRYGQSGILLAVGSNVTINIGLTLGSTQQEVQVTADAGMVETRETSISQVIDQKQVLDLPLNGRQVSALVLLSGAAVNASFVGGLVTTKNYGSSNIASTSAISIAGGAASGTNYMMDGGDNNDAYSSVNLPFPFPDAIQEFSVQTNGLSARYGVHPGGAVNIITKSGSNTFHGGLFEFLRNGSLNARNYFAPKHDSLRRNQFGGTIGGPIQRDRLFFFFGYQGTRIRTTPPQTVNFIPTAAALRGDFSQLESAGCQSTGRARTIIDPRTRQPFPNSVIPASLINPHALALLKYVPTSADPCGRIVYGIPAAEDENQFIARADWVKNEKHNLFTRYFWTGLNNPAPTFNKNLLNTTRPGLLDQSQAAVIGDTYAFSPTALNSLHLTFTRVVINRIAADDAINPQTVDINVSVGTPNFLNMSISNYFNMGCGSCAPQHTAHTVGQFADDFDLIRGRHHMSFGGNWIRPQYNGSNPYVANGVWTFNGQASGDSLVDFMLGAPNTFTQGNVSVGAARRHYLGFYAQDDVQVNSRLQLRLGIRWEPFFAATDVYHRRYHFDPQAFAKGQVSKVFVNAPPGLVFLGDQGVPEGYSASKLANFEPRVGIVWDPTGKGRETIRSSYGIFYDSPVLFFAGSRAPQSPPWGSNITLTNPPNGLSDPYEGYPGGAPFPSAAPSSTVAFPTAGVYINVPQPIRPTYVQAWSFSYQRQVSSNWLFSATYMGNKTTHQWAATEQNPAVYIPGTCAGAPCSSTRNTAQRRVLALQNPTAGSYYSTIALSDDGSNAGYNAALFTARHRFSSNYMVLANYTYSHCISEGTMTGELSGPQYQDPSNRRGSRGNCPFDVRHMANLSFVAQSPHFAQTWTNRLLGNWQVAPLISVRTGLWFTPVTGVDNSLTGIGLDRPNVVGDPYSTTSNVLQWLNPGSFVANPLGTFGNAGSFSLVGPKYFGIDVAVTRTFQVWESHKLEMRFEAFNAGNQTRLANPIANLSSAQFGRITSAAEPRILQLGMKYHF
jgi:hypothetical protein